MGKSTISTGPFPIAILTSPEGKAPFSYGFPMVFLWFSYGFPIKTSIFLWVFPLKLPFSYGFPMVFPWTPPINNTNKNPRHRAKPSAAWAWLVRYERGTSVHPTCSLASAKICLGKFHHELTTSEPWKSSFFIGKSSPFMAARFRLVNYYNLPSNIPWIGRIISG